MKQKNKAFLFDMDGVLIDSENAWIPYQETFSTNLFGEEIYKKIGSTIGISIDDIYKKAQDNGFVLNLEQYYAIYDDQAKLIYDNATATSNTHKLINFLKIHNFKIGIVSSSRENWIEMVLKKLNIKRDFDLILSLNDRKDLKSKPYPDGYVEAMKCLEVSAEYTIILEDSNLGIQSARKSNAFTIGFTENLLPDYKQEGANTYASNMMEVIQIINSELSFMVSV